MPRNGTSPISVGLAAVQCLLCVSGPTGTTYTTTRTTPLHADSLIHHCAILSPCRRYHMLTVAQFHSKAVLCCTVQFPQTTVHLSLSCPQFMKIDSYELLSIRAIKRLTEFTAIRLPEMSHTQPQCKNCISGTNCTV